MVIRFLTKRLLALILGGMLCAGPSFGAAVRTTVALKAKTVITGRGSDLTGGVILIEDGVISEVGPADKVSIPWDAEVIDASEKVVMPGYVLAHTSEGLERANESMPDVPFLSTYDAIDPFDSFFRNALRSGITTALILPGNNTRFGGTGTIVRPTGSTVEEMLVLKPYGLKVSLQPASGQSRMGHMQRLRAFLREQREFLEDLKRKEAEAKEAGKPFQRVVPPERKPMEDLFGGDLTAFVYCPEASDVIRAIELIREFKFKAVLVLGRNTWRAARQIAAAKLPVILPPDIVFTEEEPDTGEVNLRVLPVLFKKARVTFAFQIEPSSYDARYPWQVAAEAVKYGLSEKEAIAAATVVPSGLIGMGKQIGQIQKGFRADLIVLTGDPLDPTTWVEKVMHNGEFVYDRADDEFLKGLFEGKKQ